MIHQSPVCSSATLWSITSTTMPRADKGSFGDARSYVDAVVRTVGDLPLSDYRRLTSTLSAMAC